jgi:hypothetical protein
MQGSVEATSVIPLDSSAFIVHPISPEQRLYKSILVTAMLDACGRATGTRTLEDAAQAKQEAVQWFETAGPDFVEVCDLAGFEPDLVRSKVKAYLAMAGSINSNPGEHRRASTLRDVAAHASVSQETVRRVLTNSPSVRLYTRQRVNDAIATLQYRSGGSRLNA